ncbi:hypothetical protein ABIB83_007559 [Bradyrhizobium sp. I1.8.5]
MSEQIAPVDQPRRFDGTSRTPWPLMASLMVRRSNDWEYRTMWNWMMLGLESNRVIGLRIAKLMRGGKAAQREAQRMVSEKVLAAAKAGTSLMAGASGNKIVEQYRRKVAANAKRLSSKRIRRRRK